MEKAAIWLVALSPAYTNVPVLTIPTGWLLLTFCPGIVNGEPATRLIAPVEAMVNPKMPPGGSWSVEYRNLPPGSTASHTLVPDANGEPRIAAGNPVVGFTLKPSMLPASAA